jgi:tRNA(Arg) A34 adenosine deaminase TadA
VNDPQAAHLPFLARALELARLSALETGDGGPFGAVVAKDGRVIAEGRNRVVGTGDTTWHAEMEAIREAARAVGREGLEGCTLYASGEPCPMCLAAAYWARIGGIYYVSTHADALAHGGFADSGIAAELARDPAERRIPCTRVDALRGAALDLWTAYRDAPGRVPY